MIILTTDEKKVIAFALDEIDNDKRIINIIDLENKICYNFLKFGGNVQPYFETVKI